MREERVLLEHQAEATLVRRHAFEIVTVPADTPAIERLQPGDRAQQRRLPATTRSEHRQRLTRSDREVDVIDGDMRTEPHDRGLDLEHD